MNTISFFKVLCISVILMMLLYSFKNSQTDNKQPFSKGSLSTPADTSGASASFLVISDIHLQSGKNLADAYCRCGNAGDDLWDSAKGKIDALLHRTGAARPKFLIVLGDLPYHIADDFHDSADVRKSFDAVYKDLKQKAAAAKIPLIIAPGNNDSYNGDYHALNRHALILFRPDSTNATYADNGLADIGCYAVYPLGQDVKLKVIVLNTVSFVRKQKDTLFYYGNNKQQDASAQLDWLGKQLAQARRDSEKVIIAMHIPPGIDGYETVKQHTIVNMWESAANENQFLNLVSTYQSNIVGLLASHSHMDGIKLLRNEGRDSIAALLLSVPAIAPGHGNNPAMELVTYNTNNFALQNFATLYMNYNNPGPLSNWNNAFDFRDTVGYTGNLPMLDYFRRKEITSDSVKQFVRSVYNVNAGKIKTNKTTADPSIDTSIYVDYRKL